MVTRRGAMALFSAATIFSATLVAQQSPQPQKYDQAQRRELQLIDELLEKVSGGDPAPNDLSLAWVREDILKSQANLQYVPFTVTIDASRLGGRNVNVYWRVVAKEAPERAAAEPPAGGKPAPQPSYAYEYMTSTTLPSGEKGTVALSRSFTVGPGSYDVYVVVKEPMSTQRNAPQPKVAVLTKEQVVPNLWNSELNMSSVIVSERVEPLPAPLTPQQQIERPYALGNREIIPSLDMTFGKESEITMFVLIYNPTADSANKPDVTVEYNFYTKQGEGEKFFNRAKPQPLNAQTLDPAFDLSMGHQLPSGQTIPAAVFPAGDYRLEVKVTDNLANKSVTRDVNFTVAGT